MQYLYSFAKGNEKNQSFFFINIINEKLIVKKQKTIKMKLITIEKP